MAQILIKNEKTPLKKKKKRVERENDDLDSPKETEIHQRESIIDQKKNLLIKEKAEVEKL